MSEVVPFFSPRDPRDRLNVVPEPPLKPFAVFSRGVPRATFATLGEAREAARAHAAEHPGFTIEVFERRCAFRTDVVVKELDA